MTRRMTIVFDDEELYTQLKVEAARTHRPAKDLVADALCLCSRPRADERDADPRARARDEARGAAARRRGHPAATRTGEGGIGLTGAG